MERKAFTLVEIIVAAVILALVITGMFVVFKSGERFSVEDRIKTEAENISRQVLEHLEDVAEQNFNDDKLRARPYPLYELHPDPEDELKITDNLEDRVEDKNFYYEVTLIDVDGDGVREAKKIDVTYNWIFWEEGGEQSETVKLSTIVVGPPPTGVTTIIP